MAATFRFSPACLALLLGASLTACNTGTQTGATNVETGAHKETAPATVSRSAADSSTAGLQADSARPTGQQLYEQAGEAKDRNHDGVAD